MLAVGGGMAIPIACGIEASPAATKNGPATRWHIDGSARAILEAVFQLDPFPNVATRKQLGEDLCVSTRQVQVWFQNRRQRERKRRAEGEGQSDGTGITMMAMSSESLSHQSLSELDMAGASGLPLAPIPAERYLPSERSPLSTSTATQASEPAPPTVDLPDPMAAAPVPAVHHLGTFEATLERSTSPQKGASTPAVTRDNSAETAEWPEPPEYNWQSAMATLFSSPQSPPLHPALRAAAVRTGSTGAGHAGEPTCWDTSARLPGGVLSVAARLASACQSKMLGRTLREYGGVVQVISAISLGDFSPHPVILGRVQVITSAAPPHAVLSVSNGWQQLNGYGRDEVLGRTLSILQGPATERPAVRTLMEAVRAYRPVSVKLTNYDKIGRSYEHQLSVEPLRDPTGATLCFQATSLVLRQPGDSAADGLAGVMVQMGRTPPLVGADPVPPLWTLLPFLSHQRGSRAPAAERAFGGGWHPTATLNADPPSSNTSEEEERDVDGGDPSGQITDEDFHALFVDN